MTYTSGSDSVLVALHYIINIKITLTHDSESDIIEESNNEALTAPSGSYSGSTNAMGESIKSHLVIINESHADF